MAQSDDSPKNRRPPNVLERAWFGINDQGYEYWADAMSGKTVQVHQLLAISEGEDPYKVFSGGDWHIHHKNRVPWDNRPGNIELLTREEHQERHRIYDFDPATLEELRWEKGMSIREIAERLDCSTPTVSKYLKENGLHWTNREV